MLPMFIQSTMNCRMKCFQLCWANRRLFQSWKMQLSTIVPSRVYTQRSAGALIPLGKRHVRDFHFTPVTSDWVSFVLELQECSWCVCVLLSSCPAKGTSKQLNTITWCVFISWGCSVCLATWYPHFVLLWHLGKWSYIQWCSSFYCSYTTGM